MIDLITGTPGAGKTLLALTVVEARRVAEKRDVYYSGIADLTLPWVLFGEATDPARPAMTDASEWYKLPDGAIIVIDECQRLYRPRANGSKVPEYVSQLETHRHRGFDLVLITQNPGLVDGNVRKLVNEHQHVMRKFGSTWATIHTWKGVNENVLKTRKDSTTREFKYPKEVYTWYKSAEIHTAKFKLPMKVKVFIALPFILAAAVWYAVYSAKKIATIPPPVAAASSELKNNSSGKEVATPAQYASSFTPRIEGFAFSAPRYDDLTKPTVVPAPAACIASASRCKCYTDQSTALTMPDVICRQIASGGIFLDFVAKNLSGVDRGRDSKASVGGVAPSSVSPLASVQAPPLASPVAGSSVLVAEAQAVYDGQMLRSMRPASSSR